MARKTKKEKVERLSEIYDLMHKLSDEYNKISKGLGYGVRLGVAEASIRGDEDSLYDEAYAEGDSNGLEGEELDAFVEKYIEENKDLVNIEGGASYREAYTYINSSDRGWFPSGLNC